MRADRKPIDAAMPNPTRSRHATRICLICADEFAPATDTARVCSSKCRFLLWKTPENRLAEHACTYCGDIATTDDHVPPESIWPELREHSPHVPRFITPACRDCNCHILSDQGFWTIAERADFVARELQTRVRDSAEWDDDELDDLGYALRTMIEESIAHDRALRSRVRHAQAVAASAKAWEDLLQEVYVPERARRKP
jgi:hypothetical protein